MRVPLTTRQAWPARETIVALRAPAIDPPGWIHLYASRNAWPADAVVYIGLEFFDADDSQWKAIVPIYTVGGVLKDTRTGVVLTHSMGGSRKFNPRNGISAPYFRHTWPLDDVARIPPLHLKVVTTHAINSLIEVGW